MRHQVSLPLSHHRTSGHSSYSAVYSDKLFHTLCIGMDLEVVSVLINGFGSVPSGVAGEPVIFCISTREPVPIGSAPQNRNRTVVRHS